MKKQNIVKVKNLYKSYSNTAVPVHVLKGLNFAVEKGQMIVIQGESGCGKSTLLNLIGSLDSPNSGDIIVDGNNIGFMSEYELATFRSKYIGFVFQFHHLLSDFTALENVMLPYLNISFDKSEARKRALPLLKRVGLADRINHKPSELSGGEQQRVAIARALVNKPMIILADEPTGNLDEKNSEQLQSLFLHLKAEQNLTILIVTHNINMFSDADRVVKLSYGKIAQD